MEAISQKLKWLTDFRTSYGSYLEAKTIDVAKKFYGLQLAGRSSDWPS